MTERTLGRLQQVLERRSYKNPQYLNLFLHKQNLMRVQGLKLGLLLFLYRFEPSKSNGIGSKIIINPIKIKILRLIILVKNSDKIRLIKSPIKNEILLKNINIAMSIHIEDFRIFVFFIPYVTPIPNESILTDSASKIEFSIF